MKINAHYSDVTLVGGTGDYLYREILDDLPNAKKVRLMTYNIEKKENSELYAALHKIQGDADFKWIFRMLSRWEDGYYKKDSLDKFKNELQNIIKIVGSNDFKCPVHVAVNEKNHAKIFGTENILYMGSQNFSEGSKNNYEIGVVIRDKKYIQQIYEKLFDVVYNADESIKNNQVYSQKVNNSIFKMLLEINKMINSISYMISEDSAEAFDTIEASEIWEDIKEGISEVTNIIVSLEEVVDQQLMDVLCKICVICDNIKSDKDIEVLVHYNYDDALDEEEEFVKDTCENWSAKRNENVQKYFSEIIESLYAKKYDEELYCAFVDVKRFMGEKDKAIFRDTLDNTKK